jgi:hypothetical protein
MAELNDPPVSGYGTFSTGNTVEIVRKKKRKYSIVIHASSENALRYFLNAGFFCSVESLLLMKKSSSKPPIRGSELQENWISTEPFIVLIFTWDIYCLSRE